MLSYEEIKIGERLKDTIELYNINKQLLCDRLTIDDSCLNRYLNDKRRISLEMLYSICSTLNISADYLLGLPVADHTGRRFTSKEISLLLLIQELRPEIHDYYIEDIEAFLLHTVNAQKLPPVEAKSSVKAPIEDNVDSQ